MSGTSNQRRSAVFINHMKKLVLLVAVLVGLGCFATPKAEAFIGINIGIPVPAPAVYVGAPYGPYYNGYYSYPIVGYWGGGYWHGRYWRSGYYNRYGYGRRGYARRVYHR